MLSPLLSSISSLPLYLQTAFFICLFIDSTSLLALQIPELISIYLHFLYFLPLLLPIITSNVCAQTSQFGPTLIVSGVSSNCCFLDSLSERRLGMLFLNWHRCMNDLLSLRWIEWFSWLIIIETEWVHDQKRTWFFCWWMIIWFQLWSSARYLTTIRVLVWLLLT